jgi:hypothetical protein
MRNLKLVKLWCICRSKKNKKPMLKLGEEIIKIKDENNKMKNKKNNIKDWWSNELANWNDRQD